MVLQAAVLQMIFSTGRIHKGVLMEGWKDTGLIDRSCVTLVVGDSEGGFFFFFYFGQLGFIWL